MAKNTEEKLAGRAAYKQKMAEKKEKKKAKKLRGRRALMKEYNDAKKEKKERKRKRDEEAVDDDSGEQAFKKRKAMTDAVPEMVVQGDAGDDFISFGAEPVKTAEPERKKIVARGKSGRPGKPSKYGPNANKHSREDKYKREKLKRAQARLARGQPKAGDAEFIQKETERMQKEGSTTVVQAQHLLTEVKTNDKKINKTKKVSPREVLRKERKTKRQNQARDNVAKKQIEAAKELQELEWEDVEDGGADLSNELYVREEEEHQEGADGDNEAQPTQKFYGLVTEDEQAYFANVSQKISANDFDSYDDRAIFIEAVFREAAGKELKLASSQSCSRCLEKVIPLSTLQQLHHLFNEFLTDLTYLVQHRFGSHCCEALFLQAAKRLGGKGKAGVHTKSLENLLIEVIDILQPNMGFLLTDRFASHVLRTLVLILSGGALDDPSNHALLASRKKENQDDNNLISNGVYEARKVPDTFKAAIEKLITSATSSLDTAYLRSLATNQIGSPFLQLLLKLELGNEKAKDLKASSIFKRLLPDTLQDPETESSKFVSYMMYDATGSHVVEILVNEVDGKTFKELFSNVFKPKLSSMIKNDVAVYVANKVLARLGADDLREVRDAIVKEIPVLVGRRWMGSLRVYVERCVVRGVDLQPIVDALDQAYEHHDILPKMINLNESAQGTNAVKRENADASRPRSQVDQHGCLLARALLQSPQTAVLVQNSILSLPSSTLLNICSESVASRIIQTALDPLTPTSTPQFRKQLISKFYGTMTTIARSAAGSYVADILWSATHGNMQYMKEKLAQELQDNEKTIRDDRYGRTVWRNWSMDLYGRRRVDWHALNKAENEQAVDADPRANEEDGAKKTPIQLARERHAKAKGTTLEGQDRTMPGKNDQTETKRKRTASSTGV